jgi:formate dehydrogenase major subunit
MAQVMPSLANITWERLEREDAVTYPCAGPDEPGKGVIFGDGFPTASGRGKFVPTQILPPDELPDATFPLVLTTGRLLEHWHTGSMTRRASVLDALEPDAYVHVNPDDLGRWNIVPGQMVRVATRRGAIELAARSDPYVPAGVVFIPFCYSEAAVNFLTNPALDPFGKIPELKFAAARLEPANAVTATAAQ